MPGENTRPVTFHLTARPFQDPRPLASPQTSSGFRADFQHVIRGLSPFMEQSQNLNVGNWLRHSTALLTTAPAHRLNIHQHGTQSFGASAESGNSSNGGDRSDFVVSLENETGSPPSTRENPVNGGTDGGAYAAGNNNNDPNTRDVTVGQHADGLRQSMELRAAISVIEKYMPFFLILLAKLIYDHFIGILVMIGFIVTFTHANNVIKREVGKQAKRNASSLLAVIINLLTCIFFIYYVFDQDKLYRSLVFLPTSQRRPYSLWDLFWVVGVTDFVLKLMTIIVKAIVVILPGNVLAFQRKGKYYLFIEQTSQTYRALTPIQPWLLYLLEAYEGVGKLVGVILCAAYIIAKGNHFIQRFRDWKTAFSKLIQSVTYGCAPSHEQLEAAGNLCPICQDGFRQATMLHCKHIFCEECVSLWFDRERTCPMCRAQIADDPTWRDGATAFFLQLF